VTQIERIRGIIDTLEEREIFNIQEIRERTNLPLPSIRRVLGTISKSGEISRIEPGLFRINRDDSSRFGGQVDDFHRKFVSGLFYCGSDVKRQFFAITFEANNIDREEELIRFLEDGIASDCSKLRENHGYSSQSGFEDRESVPRYPEIEGGEL